MQLFLFINAIFYYRKVDYYELILQLYPDVFSDLPDIDNPYCKTVIHKFINYCMEQKSHLFIM